MADESPQAIVDEIRKEQQRLNELQQAVLQGRLSPQEYMREQQKGVERIHELERKIGSRQ